MACNDTYTVSSKFCGYVRTNIGVDVCTSLHVLIFLSGLVIRCMICWKVLAVSEYLASHCKSGRKQGKKHKVIIYSRTELVIQVNLVQTSLSRFYTQTTNNTVT